MFKHTPQVCLLLIILLLFIKCIVTYTSIFPYHYAVVLKGG
jgi:hypothetical protein